MQRRIDIRPLCSMTDNSPSHLFGVGVLLMTSGPLKSHAETGRRVVGFAGQYHTGRHMKNTTQPCDCHASILFHECSKSRKIGLLVRQRMQRD
jgi:hypothetical protein